MPDPTTRTPLAALPIQITFYSGFRVGATHGRDDLDLAIQPDDPLPADSLKGLMRVQARRLTTAGHVPEHLVDQVFGTTASSCPWTWTSANPAVPVTDNAETTSANASPQGASWPPGTAPAWRFAVRHRTAIDEEAGAAIPDLHVSGEQAWAHAARFTIYQLRPVDDRPAHEALLRLSARSVHAVGGWRRRGLGWVGITPLDDSPPERDLQLLHGRHTNPEQAR